MDERGEKIPGSKRRESRRGNRYGIDPIAEALENIDEGFKARGGLPKHDTSMPVADEVNTNSELGKPVEKALEVKATGIEINKVEPGQPQVVKSDPMKAELPPIVVAQPEAQAEQLSEQEKARRKYYDEQLFDDLMMAVKRVDNSSPKAKDAYEARDKARGRLKAAGLDMEEIVKRKQFRNEPEDQYREYARRVRDNAGLIDTVTDFLSHSERILRKQQQTEYYVDFLVGLGVKAESIKAVIDENVRTYKEQQDQMIAMEPVSGTTEEGSQTPERKKRELSDVEQVIEAQPVDYWVEYVVQFGIDEKQDARMIRDFIDKGLDSPEWKGLTQLLGEMAKAAEKDKDQQKFEALKKIIDGLRTKPVVISATEENDDEVRNKKNEDAREKWIKEMKMYTKMGILRARKEIFEYWSTDEYDGENVVAAVYNNEIGTVKDLRMRVLDVLGQSRELNRGAQVLARVVDRVVNNRLRGLETSELNKLKLIRSYREWALTKATKMSRQIEGRWKDEDPRVWDEDTPEEMVVTKIRQDLLAKEMASKRSGGRWVEIIDYHDPGGADYRVLDCIHDEVLKDEMSKEIEARDHLDEFFRGYDISKGGVKDLIAYFDRFKKESKIEIKTMILPLALGRLGLGDAISIGIQKYIELGEKGFHEYYTKVIDIPNLGGNPKRFVGRNELRRRLFELKQTNASSSDIDLIDAAIKASESRDDNFFSLPKTSEDVDKIRERIERRVRSSNTVGDIELNELNAQSGELLGLRLVYILGLAAKFNFEQDSTNNMRDDLASLYRMDERWQINKRAVSALQTPATVSGPRVASYEDRPLARAVLMVSWIEMMSEISTKNVVANGDTEIKRKIEEISGRAYEIREKRKGPDGIYLDDGELGDSIADYLETEMLSPIYQVLREGRFDEIQWNLVKSEFGKLAAFASFALDVRTALEQPGSKPESGTPDEKGMIWLRDKVAAVSGLYKLKPARLPEEDDSHYDDRCKRAVTKDQEEFINAVVYRWANAILEDHDPRNRGVVKAQQWSGPKYDEFLDAMNNSGLLTNTNSNLGENLMGYLVDHYGYRFKGLYQRGKMGLRTISMSSGK